MNELQYLDEIGNYVFTSVYARYDDKHSRRETWEESTNRVLKMHLKKFKYLPEKDLEEIKWAFSLVESKHVIPSMRSMQFGGKAIEAHNARMFNCSVRHIDSIRSFAEIFYMALCGVGTGIGLYRHFLDRLPNLVDYTYKTGTVVTYVVEDTIEGWADSVEALLNCYFQNTAYTGRKIVFDYSKIRKKGAPLKTGGGKAPGYKGLKNAHQKIKLILDHIIENSHETRLNTIPAYDVLMHCFDAVLSGGIRRSASSIMFDNDDENMINAKTYFTVIKKGRFEQNEKSGKYEGYVIVDDSGYRCKTRLEVTLSQDDYDYLTQYNKISWIHVHPQRARSNNSVLLLRDKVTKEEFMKIYQRTKEFGEPGFVFGDHPHELFNP